MSGAFTVQVVSGAVQLQRPGDGLKPVVVISHNLGPQEARELECLEVYWTLETLAWKQ